MNDTVLKEKKLRSKEVLHEKFRAILTARQKQLKKIGFFTGRHYPQPTWMPPSRFIAIVKRFDLQIDEVIYQKEFITLIIKVQDNLQIETYTQDDQDSRNFIKANMKRNSI